MKYYKLELSNELDNMLWGLSKSVLSSPEEVLRRALLSFAVNYKEMLNSDFDIPVTNSSDIALREMKVDKQD